MRISDCSSDVCSSDLGFCRRCCQRAALRSNELLGDRPLPWSFDIETLVGRSRNSKLSAPCREVADATGSVEHAALRHEIGRASCRERVCQSVVISVGAVTFKKMSLTYIHSKTI